MKLDFSQFHPSTPPQELGGYVRAALMDERYPYVHVPNALPEQYRETDAAKQYAMLLSRPIGTLVASNQLSDTLVEEIGGNAVGYAFHTEHPYRKRPERFIGLFALRVAGAGMPIDLLHASDLVKWASGHPEYAQLFARIISRPVLFRKGEEKVERPVLNVRGPLFRFDVLDLNSRKITWRNEVADLFDQASSAAKRVIMQPGDALFFNNFSQLHRLGKKDRRQLLLRTRMAGRLTFHGSRQ